MTRQSRQSREDQWNDDDFQPLNLLGKGDYQAPKQLLSDEAQAKHDKECDAIEARHRAKSEKIEATRKLHEEILKEFPTLSSTHHILDELDTPEKIRRQLTQDLARIQYARKPILKKK